MTGTKLLIVIKLSCWHEKPKGYGVRITEYLKAQRNDIFNSYIADCERKKLTLCQKFDFYYQNALK